MNDKHTGSGDAAGGRPPGRRWGAWAALILAAQAAAMGASLPRNAVTVDEFVHLPAGVSYWRLGRFWCYHHNPPLVRLLFALPAVASGAPLDPRPYAPRAGTRTPDFMIANAFLDANRGRYVARFVAARAVVVALTAAGGWLVFLWSSRLFGGAGGLISLGLWATCPEVLAHGGLVTPDMGAAVLGLAATYLFWIYLRGPTYPRALGAGFLLGLALASKFTAVVLPAVWAAAAAGGAVAAGRSGWRPDRRAAGRVAALALAALLTLNDVYLFEGSFRPLGSFDFRSRLLTRPAPPGRENRFRGTPLGGLPVPLPEHYVLGFDDQAYDVDTFDFYKYFRGELRRGPGWYGYYAYGLLVKTPLPTLGLLLAAAVAGLASRRYRVDPTSEWTLGLPAAAVLILVSAERGLNSHLRYVLPALPFLFVSAGRLGRFAAGSRARSACVVAALAGSAASVGAVHPDYLTYFNEAAGGPDRGIEHLAESNLDWGQGLIPLHDWLARHAPGRTVRLAYFGLMPPELLGIPYELPAFGPEAGVDESTGPFPGLHAVSANFLIGFPFTAPDGTPSGRRIPRDAYRYFRRFRPVAIPGHSIFVYDITPAEADRVRAELGLPPLQAPPAGPP